MSKRSNRKGESKSSQNRRLLTLDDLVKLTERQILEKLTSQLRHSASNTEACKQFIQQFFSPEDGKKTGIPIPDWLLNKSTSLDDSNNYIGVLGSLLQVDEDVENRYVEITVLNTTRSNPPSTPSMSGATKGDTDSDDLQTDSDEEATLKAAALSAEAATIAANLGVDDNLGQYLLQLVLKLNSPDTSASETPTTPPTDPRSTNVIISRDLLGDFHRYESTNIDISASGSTTFTNLTSQSGIQRYIKGERTGPSLRSHLGLTAEPSNRNSYNPNHLQTLADLRDFTFQWYLECSHEVHKAMEKVLDQGLIAHLVQTAQTWTLSFDDEISKVPKGFHADDIEYNGLALLGYLLCIRRSELDNRPATFCIQFAQHRAKYGGVNRISTALTKQMMHSNTSSKQMSRTFNDLTLQQIQKVESAQTKMDIAAAIHRDARYKQFRQYAGLHKLSEMYELSLGQLQNLIRRFEDSSMFNPGAQVNQSAAATSTAGAPQGGQSGKQGGTKKKGLFPNLTAARAKYASIKPSARFMQAHGEKVYPINEVLDIVREAAAKGSMYGKDAMIFPLGGLTPRTRHGEDAKPKRDTNKAKTGDQRGKGYKFASSFLCMPAAQITSDPPPKQRIVSETQGDCKVVRGTLWDSGATASVCDSRNLEGAGLEPTQEKFQVVGGVAASLGTLQLGKLNVHAIEGAPGCVIAPNHGRIALEEATAMELAEITMPWKSATATFLVPARVAQLAVGENRAPLALEPGLNTGAPKLTLDGFRALDMHPSNEDMSDAHAQSALRRLIPEA